MGIPNGKRTVIGIGQVVDVWPFHVAALVYNFSGGEGGGETVRVAVVCRVVL